MRCDIQVMTETGAFVHVVWLDLSDTPGMSDVVSFKGKRYHVFRRTWHLGNDNSEQSWCLIQLAPCP